MKQWGFWAFLPWILAVGVSAVEPESQPVSPHEALSLFSVDPGYAVELVAAEPLVQDPVGIDWGFDGKLWVVEMADYPYGLDGEGKPGGRVRFLTDTDGDGRMDRSTLFLDGLSFPTSVMAWHRGVLIAAAPDILYAEDSDGDGRADVRTVLFTGFMEGNQQLRLNGLRWGLDNWVYAASGGHHAGFGAQNRIRVGPSGQGEEIALGSGDLRFHPGTLAIERIAGPSQFGRVRDDWGNWFGVQNSYPLWHYVLEEAILKRNPHVTTPDPRQQLRGQQPRVFGNKPSQKRFHGFDHVGRYTSACGPSIYRDSWLYPPEEGLTHAFTCEPFSNLVQHHHLTRSGVSFAGSRAPSASETDFLASSDRWCRPVMTRTGPDGALWIVDMYRYMIEHPDWLPQNGRDELKPFYRHGADRGRIYRVVVQGKERRPIPRLAGKDPVSLVSHLAHANGLVRDAAQRLLVVRQSPGTGARAEGRNASPPGEVVLALRQLLAQHRSPRVRVQALATLAGLGRDDAESIRFGLADSHFAVRAFAVRLAQTASGSLCALAADPDPVVRLQVAAVLGQFDTAEAGAALLQLAQRSETDPFTTATILSAVPKHFGHFARSAGDLRHSEAIVQGLLSMAPAFPEQESVLLEHLFARGPAPSALDFRLLSHWLDVAGSRAAQSRQEWEAILRAARECASDAGAEAEIRLAALGLMGRRAEDWETEREILLPCLQAQSPIAVQRAAVEALRRSREDTVPEILLGRWLGFSPDIRRAVVDALIEYPAWRAVLLEHLESQSLQGRDIAASQQQRLLKLEPGAAQWLQVPQGRAEALLDRAGALKLTGRAEPGRAVFAERCVICHQVGELGKPIGPDLRALTNRSAEAVYAAILDPNRAVEPLYLAYTATTDSGEAVHGILKGETGNTLAFMQIDGTERKLLRRELRSLVSSQASLMPEGLEAGLSDQALADLIAFVQTLE